MGRDFNQTRFANAVLKTKAGINAAGVYYAIEDNADGYNVVEVSNLPSVELFIGQGTELHLAITEWVLFNSQESYGGIGEDAFAHFPSLENITIYQADTDSVMTIDDDAFTKNLLLTKIYVNPNKLAEYQTEYATKSFVGLFAGYSLLEDWVVPTQYNGVLAPLTLTKEWIEHVTENLPQPFKNAKTNIIVPDYFTSVDVGMFNEILSIFPYASELKFYGTITLPSGFLNGATWCKHVWLSNGTSTLVSPYVTDDTNLYNDFRIVAPYNQFQAYFMQEHNITNGETPRVCPIVGYKQFVSGASMDVSSETGTYAWFSNIDFDTTPETLEDDPSYIDDYIAPSTGYYYCYDKTSTIVIQGSGNLTSSIVENSINGLNTPLSWITKISIPATFQSAQSGCLDVIDNYLQNDLTLELNYTFDSNIYTNVNSSSTKINKVIFNAVGTIALNTTNWRNLTQMKSYTFINATQITYPQGFASDFKLFAYAQVSLTNVATNGFIYSSQATRLTVGRVQFENYTGKIFIGANDCAANDDGTHRANTTKTMIYLPASSLNVYRSGTNGGLWTNQYILDRYCGVIDGAGTYQKVDGKSLDMNYPKLTGIDTASNIQALTPTTDALYLASDTGDLWSYDSALSTWTNLFSGYTPTWYSDEGCTTTVLPSAMDTTHTYYVKLTAI